MDYLYRVFEVLYRGLCCDKCIGILIEVVIRRDMIDMEDMIERFVYIYCGCMIMKSGSYREGFRFILFD